MRSDKIYHSEEQEQDTFEWMKAPPGRREVEGEAEDEEEEDFPK